jgi:hypothetical protein
MPKRSGTNFELQHLRNGLPSQKRAYSIEIAIRDPGQALSAFDNLEASEISFPNKGNYSACLASVSERGIPVLIVDRGAVNTASACLSLCLATGHRVGS